jgi:hypothetical protein
MSENEEKNDLPSVKDVRDQITVSLGQEVKAQSNFERDFKNASIAQQAEYAHLAGLVDHYRHKGRWSWFLMALLFLMIFFFNVYCFFKLGAVNGILQNTSGCCRFC